MDSFFKTLIMHCEVGAQAYRLAKAEKRAGRDIDIQEFVRSEINTPGSVSWNIAMEVATEQTFQDSNWLTAVAKHVTQGADKQVPQFRAKAEKAYAEGRETAGYSLNQTANALVFAAKMMSIIFPFVKTPANILRMGIRKSPLGSISLAYLIAHAIVSGSINFASKKPSVRNIPMAMLVKAMAEQVQAWTAFFMLFGAAEGDDDDDKKKFLIVGGRPFTERGARDELMRKYGSQYVIILRDDNGKETRIPFAKWEPVATVLGTTIDMMRQIKAIENRRRVGLLGDDPGTISRAGIVARAVIGDLANQAEDKSFLQGFSSLMREYDSIKRSGNTSKGIKEGIKKWVVSGAVPNAIRQPMRNIDELVRSSNKKNGWYDAFPIGENAGPLIDLWGEEVEKGGNAFTRLLVPLASKQKDQHPIQSHLDDWNMANPDNPIQPTTIRTVDTYVYGPDGKTKVALTDPKDIERFERELGHEFSSRAKALAATIDKIGPPEDLKKLMDAIRTDARTQVRKTFNKTSAFQRRKPTP